MSNEIDRTRSTKITRAVEQMFRIYGHDFGRAFDALDKSRMLLDSASVSQAATAARYAAVCLRDAAQENDRGRSPLEIVAEIITIFPPDRRLNWQDSVVFNVDCINEVQTRLSCGTERAIALLKEVTNPSRPQLENPEAKVDFEEIDAEPVFELESGETDSK